MRLWIISDLHVEFEAFTLPDPLPVADVVVVPGDFGIGGVASALEWLDRNVPPTMDAVVVAGNHDFYDTFHPDAVKEARDRSSRLAGIHFLENDSVTIGGTTFIGCTLWTDYMLLGNRELAMWEASRGMTDYRRIKYTKRPFSKFDPLKALRAHQESRRYLERALTEADGPVVVVSHHAPSPMSVPVHYKGHRLSPAYASDLDDLILRHQPKLWVHGHIHERVDYSIGETRVFSNPRGYPRELTGFDPGFVIQV